MEQSLLEDLKTAPESHKGMRISRQLLKRYKIYSFPNQNLDKAGLLKWQIIEQRQSNIQKLNPS